MLQVHRAIHVRPQDPGKLLVRIKKRLVFMEVAHVWVEYNVHTLLAAGLSLSDSGH